MQSRSVLKQLFFGKFENVISIKFINLKFLEKVKLFSMNKLKRT